MLANTKEMDLVKNSTTALQAASKQRRCSSSYNLERKLDEYHSREEDLNEKIAELQEVNSRTQRSNVDLYRVIRAQKSLEKLKSDATAEDVIEKAWQVNESIKAIAEEMSPGTGSTAALRTPAPLQM